MALKACPQCGHMVSRAATSCPSCGHPLKKQAAAGTNGGIGCGLVLLVVVGFFIYAANEGHKLMEVEKANPTCVSDYTKCSDNKEVVEKHQSPDHVSLAIECSSAAKKAASYGEPEFPFFAFGSFYPGRSYIDGGSAIMIEKEAKYKNAFNAKKNVVATCVYNLKTDQAAVTVR